MASRGSPSPRRPYRGNNRGGRGRGANNDAVPSSPTNPARGRGRGAQLSSPSPSRGSQIPSSPSRGGWVPRPDGPPRRGVCNFYWSTGACTRGFNCIYSHEVNPDLNVLTQASTDSPATDSTPNLDFFSIEGLAISNGSVRSEEQNMKPPVAHNHLKALLQKGEITTASRAIGMVRVFGSVNTRNEHWDSERAQQFLDTVVHGDALLRVGEILRWPTVSAAGSGSGSLSFQRGYFPLLEFFASDLILKTTVIQNTNMLYTLLELNYDAVHNTLISCMEQLIEARSWREPSMTGSRACSIDGVLVFKVLSVILSQFFQRFKSAIRNHPNLLGLVEALYGWFAEWRQGILSDTFEDPIVNSQTGVRDLTLEQLERELSKLRSIARRESNTADEQRRPAQRTGLSDAHRHESLVSQIGQAYDPPGDLREEGPRHDNDFANIADIRIAPTHQELTCGIDSYLPTAVVGAPHHLPENSMEKHLDRQYRLLREELIYTVRQSVRAVSMDLDIIQSRAASVRMRMKHSPTMLEKLIESRGGAYRSAGRDSVFFHVYTGVEFTPVKAERRSFSVGIRVDTPPGGTARHADARKRADYWEHSKKLSWGSLIVLVIVSDSTQVFLGTIVSRNTETAESAKANADSIELRVSFFDAEIELLALRSGTAHARGPRPQTFLLDNGVMFESVRPFLDTLRTVEPTSIPFSEYIAREDNLSGVPVEPPRYARVPGFAYDLSSLNKSPLNLRATDHASVTAAREALIQNSALDVSQVHSVVDALTREICLIQGPPGTGKSFTGKEILRVLLANKVRPIMLIAFTNHALDHMLESVLDARITDKIVRLGSRSSNERVASYNLSNLEAANPNNSMKYSLNREYGLMMNAEKEMKAVLTNIQLPTIQPWQVVSYLEIHYSDAAEMFEEPPFWIRQLMQDEQEDADENGEWRTVGKDDEKEATRDRKTPYGFWASGSDIEFLFSEPAPGQPDKRALFFSNLGFTSFPAPPILMLEHLSPEELAETDIWALSLPDRMRLSAYWAEEVRAQAYQDNLDEFNDLRRRYDTLCQNFKNIKDQAQQELLKHTELIGCTTTGAAKLVSLLNIVSPRVLIVEEAGQVLESHILASLVPSVEQLICIGDPQQLRPTLATYQLSMDSEKGRTLYKFDQSLMERLASSGSPMSLINVQRRMRPEISHFIRTILYPSLTDHTIVKQYPAVRGVEKNVFFFTHTHQEGGESDSVSKYNMFEAEFIRDLVMYFLKQGTYSGKGDIAVLCAYLGQLQKVRAALADAKLAVTLDERDEEQLERQGADPMVGPEAFEHISVTRHIRLGTVDTFQGEEAKIVIVSLVRNSGDYSTEAPIGFLKSSNRINVALSRAQHGLYVLGNAANLRQNATWNQVLTEMESRDQIGNTLNIVCARHQSLVRHVNGPNQLPLLAPEGGCLERCDHQLKCGHSCKSVCHPDQGQHARMKCEEPCPRIQCPRQHPCPRVCGDDCGECEFKMFNVRLPCGHSVRSVPCHQFDRLETVRCNQKVEVMHPFCEHKIVKKCYEDASTIKCKALCGGTLDCCAKACSSQCHSCVALSRSGESTGRVVRSQHKKHPCERILFCQHLCGLDCSQDHQCNERCQNRCRQSCDHRDCSLACSMPCPPCLEPCTWECPHHSCPVACGSICARLPCDEACTNTLKCGHACPSVCGEPCAKQKCISPECLSEDKKRDIVDFIMQRTLGELDLSSNDISERVITLLCGHVFTVETLDGHCHMSDFYDVDPMTGMFIGMIAPPTDFQVPPVCPTCRGSITSPRYGRVTKRGNLDLLETNIAGNMSKDLQSIVVKMEELSLTLDDARKSAKELPVVPKVKSDEELDNLIQKRSQKLENPKGELRGPLASKFILGIGSIHGLSKDDTAAWKRLVRPFTGVYEQVLAVATSHGPHLKAYHAALSTLYRLELSALTSDQSRVIGEPESIAMAEVNKKIGQPPHKADTKYQVEAFLLSLDVRLQIVEIAESRYEGLKLENAHDRRLWHSLVDFLYASCDIDAEAAKALADRSSASRQIARCTTKKLRNSLERIRFGTQFIRDNLALAGELTPTNRLMLVRELETAIGNSRESLRLAERSYIRARNCLNDPPLALTEREWFRSECRKPIEKIFTDFEKFTEHIRKDTVYQPLSRAEKASIVAALDFGYRGHFYNCPNGHTFVIGECGGAMQVARCPDCGAAIGGSNHTLNSSNTIARDFEEISREQGGRNPHWPWAQGA